MATFRFQLGESFETLTKPEMAAVLAAEADRQMMVQLRGVKDGDIFLNLMQIQQVANQANTQTASVNVLSLPGVPPYSPTAGFVWAVMTVGWELSAASNVRIYKGAPPGLSNTLAGIGRLMFGNTGTPSAAAQQFSKGQAMMKSGDQLTFVTVTPAAFFLSLYVAYIQCPAERVGELLL